VRIGVAIPQSGRYLVPDVQQRLATELEALGVDSLWVSDHVIVPEGERYIPEVMHEPLALLAWLAGRTSTITLGTSVLILPYRDPVFTAKFLASVDVLAEGRLVLGVGVGWMVREFEALSADHDQRGAVSDEYLRVIRNLWETDTSSFEGRWKRYRDMRLFPKRAAQRTAPIPIVVGGNSPRSIRRAAELGDGWHPINQAPADLAEGVARYRAACGRAGRPAGPVLLRQSPGARRPDAPDDRPLLGGTADEQADDVRAWAAAGCDELVLSPTARSADELLDVVGRFVTEVRPLAR